MESGLKRIPLRDRARTEIFRRALNLWPCIRGTGGRVSHLSTDYHELDVTLPLTWRTKNRVGTIFGGSLYASTDPFYMIMLMQILGKGYVVWDKGAQIRFKRPGTRTLYAKFRLSPEFVADVRAKADSQGEYTFDLPLEFRDVDGVVHTEITKTLYVATKEFYREKLARRNAGKEKG